MLAGQLGQDGTHHEAHRDPFRFPRLLDEAQLEHLVERAHHRDEIRAQHGLLVAQFIHIEQFGDDRAALLRTAGALIVIVRPVGDAVQPDPLIDEKVDHLRCPGDIGLPPLAAGAGSVVVIADHRVEIGVGGLLAIRHAVALHKAVVGDPHHPARARSGAADQRGLLKDQHRLAGLPHHQGAAHGAAATADDDPVECLVECAHSSALPLECRFGIGAHMSALQCAASEQPLAAALLIRLVIKSEAVDQQLFGL